MEQFNKVISFVLGLVVVIIFLAVVTGKINLKNGVWPFTRAKTTPTAAKLTPTPLAKNALTLTPTQRNQAGITAPTPGSANYRSYSYSGSTPSTIPSTGPELLLPLAVSTLAGGSLLKKIGRK